MQSKRSRKAIEEAFGIEADLFCGLLAATSAHTKLDANYSLACKAYRQIKHTGTIQREGYIGVHYDSILAYLDSGRIRGRKCQNFYQALCLDSQAIAVDIWICRWFGTKRKQPTQAEYNTIEQYITLEAKQVNLTPAEYQAKIWCETRGDNTNYADLIRKRGIQYSML